MLLLFGLIFDFVDNFESIGACLVVLERIFIIYCSRKEERGVLHKKIHPRKLVKANYICLCNLPEFYVYSIFQTLP